MKAYSPSVHCEVAAHLERCDEFLGRIKDRDTYEKMRAWD
jgi:hypothetical protein